jgi:uncharacterized protein YndB with AHSA1/START domain
MTAPIDARTARAAADLAEGLALASVEVAAAPERVFQALASPEVCRWWVRPGVFDTRTWEGDLRKGGRWKITGMARGRDYGIEGEFLEVDPPRRLVHTWRLGGSPAPPSTVTYLLEPAAGGTRITLRHSGLAARESCANTAIGWETSFERLSEILSAARP